MQTPDVGRSIRRFLQLLELFRAEQRPLTSNEIADALDAPKSSIGSLLRALVDLRVLIIDRRLNTYFPTVHFADLNAWIIQSWFPDDALLARVDQLRDRVGETVVLSTPSDLTVEVLYAAQGVHPITLSMVTGQRLWMPFSAIGNAYLSTLPSASLSALTQRLAQAAKDSGRPFDGAALQKAIRHVRRAKVAVAYDGVVAEAGGVAVALPEKMGPRPLIISIGGPSERIRARETDIARHLLDFANASTGTPGVSDCNSRENPI